MGKYDKQINKIIDDLNKQDYDDEDLEEQRYYDFGITGGYIDVGKFNYPYPHMEISLWEEDGTQIGYNTDYADTPERIKRLLEDIAEGTACVHIDELYIQPSSYAHEDGYVTLTDLLDIDLIEQSKADIDRDDRL